MFCLACKFPSWHSGVTHLWALLLWQNVAMNNMGQPGVGGLGHKHTSESKSRKTKKKKKLNNRREIKIRNKMSARSHRLRQKVHHGGLELWLIGMRLEGTETHNHSQTQERDNSEGHGSGRGRGGGRKHTHTHTQHFSHIHTHTHKHKQHLTLRKVPESDENTTCTSPCGVKDTFNGQTNTTGNSNDKKLHL